MDLDVGILINDLSISIEEENIKDSSTNIIESNNEICLKTLDYMLF